MYLLMLIIGLGFIIITLVVGELGEFEGVFGFISPSVIALMLVAAGAFGVFLGDKNSIITLPLSIAVGFGLGLLFTKFVVQPLRRSQNTSTVDQQALIGLTATVDSRIVQGGFGRILYTVNGSRVQSPAKTIDGAGVDSGAAVKIMYIENKIFFVEEEK